MGLFDATQSVLQEAMSGAALREKVLANNIANANTPEFTRSDVDFQGAIRQALASGEPAGSVQFAVEPDNGGTRTLDGNNVDIDEEMSDLSENTIAYQSFAEIAHARLQMIDDAAKTS